MADSTKIAICAGAAFFIVNTHKIAWWHSAVEKKEAYAG